MRVAAIEALSWIGSELLESRAGGGTVLAAATALIQSSKDPEPNVRSAAALALGSMDVGLARSRSGGATLHDAAAALILSLKDPEPAVRAKAAFSMGKFVFPNRALIDRKPILDAFAEALCDRDAEVRRAVIVALNWNPGGGEPPKELALALKDESAENRAAAVIGLTPVRQGLDPWLPILLRLAEHDPDRSVREHCFNTLSHAFRPPAVTAAAVPALIASLNSGDAKVRGKAASILGELKADAMAVIPELLRILNEPLDPGVESFQSPLSIFDPACEAALALGKIAPDSMNAKQVIAALIEVVRSGPLSRRGWAADALGEFGPDAENAVPVLIKATANSTANDNFHGRASAALALGKIAPDTSSADQALATLVLLLQSQCRFPQVKAIEAVSLFGPKAAAAVPTVRALKDARNPVVRDAAVRALLAIEKECAP